MKASDSIRTIKGIGEKSGELFGKLGITTVEELLAFYPREYDLFTAIQPVSSVREGETAILEGSFAARPKMASVRNLKIITCRFRDSTGQILVSWFNMPYLMRSLKMGMRYIIRGRIARKNGVLQMVQPKLLTKEEYANQKGKLSPVYPLTAGLTNHAVAKAVAAALKECEAESDFLPLELRKEYDLQSHKKAVQTIHFPDSKESYAKARRRLVFEEFFLFSLALRQVREKKHSAASPHCLKKQEKTKKLLSALPYTLTSGQEKAWKEIQGDLQSGYVMNRLVQGDVGSGKTVVAMLALLLAAENGYQGAIMVPTEVLAKQHYEEFRKYLEPLGINVVLLTGSMTAAAKREAGRLIEGHQADIIVGTHALIQEKVSYADLALVVTDEQHRFGVRQREQFSAKGEAPHMLVMSATPIPRTLAIILYGDLDVSVIDVLPSERLPIKNCAVDTNYRPQAYRFMEKQVQEGHQVYIICPMVEESENSEAENVMDYTNTLREVLPPSIHVEYLHGKMRPALKNEIMEAFASGEIDILVSTTVIEVGINVPNATVMMIENAERFGLAQLHQLRGRVGRGAAQSYCIFMAGNPSKETMERLRIIEGSNDGFYVAGQDLKLRGPGDLFGIRQSGDLLFRLGDIYQDAKELQQANEAASSFEKKDIQLLCKKHERLKRKMAQYTGGEITI
ncbi:ATP-dependent DNA helicase RecG [bacterium D16-51]|nr:ATP-dependent DNA helicase RecG [bacterium D16-59]RKI62636.1 ATP-dependent DNA helicase RecG [bacterium D16-51]